MSSNTHFIFRHNVFSVDGGYFSARKGGRDPRFNLPMGDVMASVPIATLRKEFEIAEDSEDGRLLEVVKDALKHVKIIRVNDAIPSELLDGSASWSVEELHRLVARCRLMHQLVTWVMESDGGISGLVDFQRQIESAKVKEKIRAAIKKLAQELGVTEHAVSTIERRLESLANELSYIEALRERFRGVQEIQAMVEQSASANGQNLRIQEDSERILLLLSLSYKKLSSEFDVIIKQCDNLTQLLGEVETYVELIRSVRDEIRVELDTWDEVVEDWRAYAAKEAEPSWLKWSSAPTASSP